MKKANKTIALVGTGLIGGSMVLALRQHGYTDRIIGVDANPQHLHQARQLGLIEEAMSLEAAIRQSHIVLLATPVDSLLVLLPQVLSLLEKDQVVLDVGSTKLAICNSVAHHPNRGRFIATHPMAGTEYSGPGAAIPDLFKGKICVLTDLDKSDTDAIDTVQNLYAALDMQMTTMTAADHDVHVAYVSHISHIVSFALSLTVLEKERDEQRIFELAGGGFQSTARLAKSSPDTWAPIFRQNRNNVLDVLNEFIHVVNRFRSSMLKNDFDALGDMMRQANDIRRVIG